MSTVGVPKPAVNHVARIVDAQIRLMRPAMERGERIADWMMISLAKRLDRWAQNGPRAAYPARRQLAFDIRKGVRDS